MIRRLPEAQLRPLLWAGGAFVAGVALHADRVPLWVTATALICIAWRTLAALGFLGMPVRYAKLVLAAALAVAVYGQFRTLNGLNAGTALLIVMGSIKLLESSQRRDRAIVVGVALILLLAACLDRQNLARAPLYLAHAWLCCTAFAMISHDGVGMSHRTALTLAGRNLLLAAPLAFLLFTFFPRVAGSFWALPQLSGAETGLGETMSPGSISKLTETDDPAFRVTFEGRIPPPQERYWRGPVLQEFDGYTWSRVSARFYPPENLEYQGLPYIYRVTMEPHANNWWFSLDRVRKAPDRRVMLTYDSQLIGMEPVTRQITYEAISYTRTRSRDTLAITVRRNNTQLPERRNRRSGELAREMRAATTSDAAFVSAVLDYFRKGGFEYTLTPPRLDLDSVDDFLFNSRKGFCGHYASAFVSMMRAARVPSRIVTGYLGGEWNPVGSFFLVRQSEAHAWAEVWLDGSGWVRVDPTAVVAPERLQRGIYDLIPDAGSGAGRFMRDLTWLSALRQNWQALDAWFEESVVRFDFGKQLDFLHLLGIEDPDAQQLGWGLAIGLIGWMLWINRRIARRLRAPLPDRIARAYSRLCRKIARAGLAREPHQGPLAYAAALADFRPDVADVASPLLERYARLRYGKGEEANGFASAVAMLRVPKAAQPFTPHWRAMLESSVPLYRRMPSQLRLRVEPLARRFMDRVEFLGCNGLVVTDEMRLTVAVQACLLIAYHKGYAYDELRSVLLYPDEFLVTESEQDETGVVTEGTRALSGQTFDTSRIILSWADVKESGTQEEAYNVVLHEFAHHLDHLIDSSLSDGASGRGRREFEQWHTVFEREYEALCDAVDRDEPTLIDPYAAEHPAEFFAVATETFFEQPVELRRRHPHLYAELQRYYGLDPGAWPT